MSELFLATEAKLIADGYTFERKDFNRPWGGFLVLDECHKDRFISEYFTNLELTEDQNKLKVSPKILMVAPNKRLSWQYHFRRAEIWQVVQGTVAVMISDTDDQTTPSTYKVGEQIHLTKGQRHRLIGLDGWGVVAEIWMHTDAEHPSDEDDIVRLQDDFNRKTPEQTVGAT